MADAYTYLRLGEIDDIFSPRLVPDDDETLTITSCKVTLHDPAGRIVTGVNEIDATDFDHGAQDAPRGWHKVDAASLGLGLGFHILTFEFVTTDTLKRKLTVSIEVQRDY